MTHHILILVRNQRKRRKEDLVKQRMKGLIRSNMTLLTTMNLNGMIKITKVMRIRMKRNIQRVLRLPVRIVALWLEQATRSVENTMQWDHPQRT